MATRVTIEALSGGQLRDMFAAAAAWLEKHTESVNAINVFPVPDGEKTGPAAKALTYVYAN